MNGGQSQSQREPNVGNGARALAWEFSSVQGDRGQSGVPIWVAGP